jgi:hypothetical protein
MHGGMHLSNSFENGVKPRLWQMGEQGHGDVVARVCKTGPKSR